MKTVVLGTGGQLGSAFRALLGDRATHLDRTALDITDFAAVGSVLHALGPTLLINCAAYTDVEAAEHNPDLAYLVNAEAVAGLAQVSREIGARLVTFSTDYVFDGRSDEPYREADPPAPLNVYGASKLEGERACLIHRDGVLIVRTAWLLSTTHENFVTRILDRAMNGPVRVVDDQLGSPTLALDLAAKTLQAVDAGLSGIVHIVNTGEMSWFDLAKLGVTEAGMDPAAVQPCSSAEFATVARRPARSSLSTDRLASVGLEALPSVAVGLPRIVQAWQDRQTLPGSSRRRLR